MTTPGTTTRQTPPSPHLRSLPTLSGTPSRSLWAVSSRQHLPKTSLLRGQESQVVRTASTEQVSSARSNCFPAVVRVKSAFLSRPKAMKKLKTLKKRTAISASHPTRTHSRLQKPWKSSQACKISSSERLAPLRLMSRCSRCAPPCPRQKR